MKLKKIHLSKTYKKWTYFVTSASKTILWVKSLAQVCLYLHNYASFGQIWGTMAYLAGQNGWWLSGLWTCCDPVVAGSGFHKYTEMKIRTSKNLTINRKGYLNWDSFKCCCTLHYLTQTVRTKNKISIFHQTCGKTEWRK